MSAKLIYAELTDKDADPIEFDFERVFGIIEWSEYAMVDKKGVFFLVMGSKKDTCRTYITQSVDEVKKCIRQWPCQETYAIFEYNNMVDCHMVAKDYREQCGFAKSIKQSLK